MQLLSIASITLLLDRITKWWIKSNFFLGESHPVIKDIFHITYIENRGAAFGLLEDQRWIFLSVVAIFLFVLYRYWKQIQHFPIYAKIGVGMLLGGAIGNGIDRFTQHSVTDFFDFRIWPIFNIADIGICVGMTLLLLYLWKEEQE